ncbi:MAG: ADOP family duplicated permease [Gemmatimonadetes bacterium]|nr:ADOP family duplicated permease [Gemmatimonadota bacterium]
MTGRREHGLLRIARWFCRRSAPPSLWPAIEAEIDEELSQRLLTDRRTSTSAVWAAAEFVRVGVRLALERATAATRVEGRRLVSGLGRDVRQASRRLRSRAGLSLSVVATAALAIGATTAVYGVAHGVLLRPLPYPESEQLVAVWLERGNLRDSPNEAVRAFAEGIGPDAPVYRAWADADAGFDHMGAYRGVPLVVQDPEGASVVAGQTATSGLFRALGVDPILGRYLVADDDAPGAEPVVVLSEEYWGSRFGRANDVLGRRIVVDGAPRTIVGVMPRGFRAPPETVPFPGVPSTPIAMWSQLPQPWLDGGTSVSVVARLAMGVSIDQANRALSASHVGLVAAAAFPDLERTAARAEPLLDWVVGDVGRTLWFLLAAVGLVLVVATVNIASMFAASSLASRRELAVRSALGARGSGLLRMQLIESGILALIGGAAGVGLATAGQSRLLELVPPTVPRVGSIDTDPTVLVLALLLTCLTAGAIGAFPAWLASRVDPQDALRGESRGSSPDRRARRALTGLAVAELSLAFALTVGAVMIGGSYARLTSVDRGFPTGGLVAVTVIPDPATHPGREGRDRFRSELQRSLGAMPGVEGAAMNSVPLSGGRAFSPVTVDADSDEPREVFADVVVGQTGALDVLGVPLLRGRALERSDHADGARVALVTASMERKHWPDGGALGRTIGVVNEDEPRVIVGVVDDLRFELAIATEETVLLPASQTNRATNEWVLRIEGELPTALSAVREAVATVSPSTPVRDVRVLDVAIAESIALPRLRAILIGGLAGLAALLSVIGVYGVLSYTVARQIRDVGVRMALGARSTTVVAGVVGRGLKMAVAGVGLGLSILLPVVGGLRSFLFDFGPYDPLTYVTVALATLLVAGLAAFVPARRAGAVEPVRLLSGE